MLLARRPEGNAAGNEGLSSVGLGIGWGGMKLDRFLGKHESAGRRQARQWVVERRVTVDGELALRVDAEVDRFSRVKLDGLLLGAPEQRLRIMLHKPVGVVSATVDAEHPTVLDLIDHPAKDSLHLVGRLDRNTSGLVLLTNDGQWSKRMMDPAAKVPKVYRVETLDPIPEEAVARFAEGFYFHTEDLTTLPALLEIIGPRSARLTLHEGRYHQVKRMFHRIGNRVVALHRDRIGDIALPDDLGPGQWRRLEGDSFKLG